MKYELDRSSKKFICPSCGQKRFVKYINLETKEYLPDEFGRCDREHSCGYFHKPEKTHKANTAYAPLLRKEKPSPKPIDFVPENAVKKSLREYDKNKFILWLNGLFGNDDTTNLVNKYRIGTSKLWPGANIFWQIDINGNIRTGKIMLYDLFGHRIKDKNAMWVHRLINDKFNLRQCLFGEHLLKDAKPDQVIAIVESEKTAIIASYFLPNYIWLASGGSHMLQDFKLEVLKNRKVILFPDLSRDCRKRWGQIARKHGYAVSNYLSHINDGSDIADHLLNDYIRIEKYNAYGEAFEVKISQYGYPACWDN